ncbi:MAG TPA: AbrB/MazE/SpoVT family DNA-binding domain-containing protein [Devosiaceae bacterium]|jgi:AbrB family looped-hinge helix DNA binding protein|nr:AbrB/MazE/SpoVT family DNA-binding domain-containing protein [Devosiaceae bacterium]
MHIAKITSKGQITIPKDVRDALHLEKGSSVFILLQDGQATLRPRTGRAVDLAGILGKPPAGTGLKVEDMDDAIGDAVVEEFENSVR